jgi:hypothetical protein
MPALLVNMINSKTREYFITRAGSDNLDDIARLHAIVYGTQPDYDLFRKKYDTAYTGVEFVGFIAYSKDRIPVAYYGVIPCFLTYAGRRLLVAQSADTMTHPQYRYKGMFVELSNMTFDLCRELGINLVFGFPNQNSYHGAVNKLGWQINGNMSFFSIPVKALPLHAAASKFSIAGFIYRAYSKLVLTAFKTPQKGIASSVIAEGFAGIERTEQYLSYKTYHASAVIKLGSARIWLTHSFHLMVGDMQGIDETNFHDTVRQLKRLAFMLGLRRLHFHVSAGTKLHKLLADAYPSIPSYPVLVQDFGIDLPLEKIRFTYADIDIF